MCITWSIISYAVILWRIRFKIRNVIFFKLLFNITSHYSEKNLICDRTKCGNFATAYHPPPTTSVREFSGSLLTTFLAIVKIIQMKKSVVVTVISSKCYTGFKALFCMLFKKKKNEFNKNGIVFKWLCAKTLWGICLHLILNILQRFYKCKRKTARKSCNSFNL